MSSPDLRPSARPASISQRSSHERIPFRFLLVAVILGLLFWVVDALLDHWLFYPGQASFFDTLIAAPSPHEIYVRLFVFGLLLAGALGLAHYAQRFARQAEQYRGVFRESPDAIFLIDPTDGSFVDFNDRACEMLGYDRPVLAKLTIPRIEARKSDAAVARKLDAIERQGQTQFETRLQTADARVIEVEVRTHPLRDQGQPLHLAVVKDISERKASTRDLEALHQRMRLALETADIGIWQYDNKTNKLVWDDAMFRLYGLSPEHFKGVYEDWERCVHPDDLVRASNEARASLLATRPYNTEFRIVRPDGEIRYIQANARVLKDDNGVTLGQIGTNYDVTERRRSEQALQESEARFRDITESLPGAVFRYLLHNDGSDSIQYMSSGCYSIWELSPDELQDDPAPMWQMILAEDVKAVAASVEQSAKTGNLWEHEWRIRTGSGRLKRLLGRAMPRYLDNGDIYWNLLVIDVSEHREAVEVLHRFFEQPLNLNMIAGVDGTIRQVNQAWAALLGRSIEALEGSTLVDFLHPDDVSATTAELSRLAQGQAHVAFESRCLDVNGEYRLIKWSASAASDARLLYAVATDITALKETEQRLEHLAHHDPLTDLPNRLLFHARLKQSLGDAARRQAMLAILFVDLDRFKQINDSVGHQVGDELLKEVALRLRRTVREADTVARISGDEFVLILEDIDDPCQAERVIDKLVTLFKEPIPVFSREIVVTACIGVSFYPNDGDEPEMLLRAADAAMYRAKTTGRNAVFFYAPELDKQMFENWHLERELHAAIKNDELYLAFQPQIDLRDGRVIGLEALLRWEHPRLGQVMPGRFIPVAEGSGLIRELGAWALRHACIQGRHWLRDGLRFGRLAVNVSGQQLQRGDFANLVEQVLEETQFPPENLELEVTESFVMRDSAEVIEQLIRMRQQDILIAIDDFGTDYSSLSRLRQLPIDRLKIDQSFIRNMTHEPNDLAITKTIIAIGQTLGHAVIAEGVETVEHFAVLAEIGCLSAQGYAIAKPMPAEAVADWIDAWQRQPWVGFDLGKRC